MPNLTKAFLYFAKVRNYLRNKSCPVDTQEETLLNLISKAKNTEFGIDHKLHLIHSVEDYQKSVPLRKYEDFWDEYWKKPFPYLNDVTWPGTIPYFCLSSGTSSGTTKYIPYTNEMIRSNSKAGLDLLIYHVLNNPNSKIFSGKSFVLGGSTQLNELAPGIFGGDLSGIVTKTLPWWAKSFYFPTAEMALISDWEKKIDLLSSNALKEDIRSFSGIPSWMLILIERMSQIAKLDEPSISKIFPNLELLTHGGVNFAPYYSRFKSLLEGGHAELREVYPASEGFIAVADKGYGEGLKLNYDHDIFFEFIPVPELEKPKPTRHWIKNVELDVDYAIVLTTAAGLWSYILGDTVKFVSTDPPRLLVTGRTSYFLSAFGEHLAGEEVEKAVSIAANKINKNVVEYSLGARYPSASEKLGGHKIVVEFSEKQVSEEELSTFCKTLTRTLCELNEDYAAHYSNGYGLKAPEVISVPEGTFAAWMKSRGKLGGQNKVPRIIPKDELFNSLLNFIN